MAFRLELITKLLALFSLVGSAMAQTTSTIAIQTGNNSTDCSATGVPSYCERDGTRGFPAYQIWDDNTNSGAQSYTYNVLGGNISPLTVQHSYLYPGATTTVICNYQPWWSTIPPSYNGHPYIGMDENNANVVNAQHNMMLRIGCNVVSPDWYGLSSSQAFNQATVETEADDLAARSAENYPLKFMIMLDQGALIPYCETGSSDQTSCLISAIESHFDYAAANWAFQPYYLTRPSDRHPIVTTFINESEWSGTDWTSPSGVWATVTANMTTANGYTQPFDIVKEFGNFTEPYIDGAFGWPQPQAYSATNQFCYDSVTCSISYSGTLYSQAHANPSQIVMGFIYKGFDDSIGYGAATNRVTAQQCGMVAVDMAGKITSNGYGVSNQLPYLLLPTWNDYEEGTAIETGIDNCWRIASATLSSGSDPVFSWTLSQTSTYASVSTIDHYRIWRGTGNGNLTLVQDNIPASATSFNMENLPLCGYPSNTSLYLQMIPVALDLTQFTNGANGNAGPVPVKKCQSHGR